MEDPNNTLLFTNFSENLVPSSKGQAIEFRHFRSDVWTNSNVEYFREMLSRFIFNNGYAVSQKKTVKKFDPALQMRSYSHCLLVAELTGFQDVTTDVLITKLQTNNVRP